MVRDVHPEYKDVVHVMKGDMSEPCLGLSEDDQRLLHETVEIVFHSAATVRFDEELRYSPNCSLESGPVYLHEPGRNITVHRFRSSEY